MKKEKICDPEDWCASDKPGEECGVFGIYDFDGRDVAFTIY